MATRKRSKRIYPRMRKNLYPVRLGQVENTANKKKNKKSLIIIVILLILVGLCWWKKDWIINLFKKKTVIVTDTVTDTVTKYIPTKTEDFPLKKGVKNDYVRNVQLAYNSVPNALLPNRTKLTVDGSWGAGMDAEFKKNGIPLVITKDMYDKGLKALIVK